MNLLLDCIIVAGLFILESVGLLVVLLAALLMMLCIAGTLAVLSPFVLILLIGDFIYTTVKKELHKDGKGDTRS